MGKKKAQYPPYPQRIILWTSCEAKVSAYSAVITTTISSQYAYISAPHCLKVAGEKKSQN